MQPSSSKTIIDTMMPSPWATYKQSLISSLVGFIRVMFSFRGTDADGVKSNRIGVVPTIIIESVAVLVSLFKIIAASFVGGLSVVLFLVSPFLNLIMLPFYRRKSIKELTKFIEQQEVEIESRRKKAEEALGGAA